MLLIEPKFALELGVFKGFSTLHLAAAASEIPGCELVSVDREDVRSVYARNGAPSRWYTFVQAESFDYLKQLDKEVNFCFLDTSHTYEATKLELNLLWPKMASGGVLALHDPLSFPAIVQAVDDSVVDGSRLLLRTPVVPERVAGISGLLLLTK